MRGELRALKQHILQLEVEAGGVRHTALRRQFNAKLGEKRREALRAQNLVGGGGEEGKQDSEQTSERKEELKDTRDENTFDTIYEYPHSTAENIKRVKELNDKIKNIDPSIQLRLRLRLRLADRSLRL